MKTLVIAPQGLNGTLFNLYRNNDPFLDVKFITKEEFIESVSYEYTSETILYLITNFGFDYNLATKFLKEMRFVSGGTSSKIKEALKIFKELENKGLIIRNEYFDYELKNSDIKVYGYSKNDPELNYFLKKYQYSYVQLNVQNDLSIAKFDDYEDELFYLFNEIGKLLDRGVSYKDIAIYGLENEINLSVDRLIDNYGINLNGLSYFTLLDEVYVKDFLKRFDGTNLESLFDELSTHYESDNFSKFKSLIRSYYSSSLSLDKQVQLFKDVLTNYRIDKTNYTEGIRLIKEPYVKEGTHLFIVNFIASNYPKVKKDDGYFFKLDLEGTDFPSLEERNNALSDFFINALNDKVHLHLSMSNKKNGTKVNSSHLVDLLKIKIIENPIGTQFFSKKEAYLKYANALDIKKNYRHNSYLYLGFKDKLNIPYMKYSNAYKGTKHYDEHPIKLSYSSVKHYYECAFKFYLSNALNLDNDFNTFPMIFGSFAHDIYEHIGQADFDTLFKNAYKKFEDRFSPKDKAFVEFRKEHIRKVHDFIESFEKNLDKPIIKRELEIKDFIAPKIIIDGKIDKFILTGDDHNYVTVIDYKTGSEEFKDELVPYGLSLQLPTYSYLLSLKPSYKDLEIIGLFIEPAFNKKGASMDMDSTDYNNELRLKGVFSDSIDKMKTLDPDLVTKSEYIYGLKIVKSGEGFASSGKGSDRFKNEAWFNSIKDTAKDLFIEAGNKILNNEFPINPKEYKSKDKSCEYCSFRDICYKRRSDYVILKNGDEEENNEQD